ncbi:MAG: glycosyltransferase family 4 protein [Planctomycetota bacterium]
MKVLLVNHTFDRSEGQGKVNAEIARALLDHGHEVTLVSSDGPEDIEGLDKARRLQVTPVSWLPSRLLRHLTFGYRTAQLIKRLRPGHDVVAANGGMTFAKTDVNVCHFVHRSWLRHSQHPLRSQRGLRRLWSLYQYAYSKQAEVWERSAYLRADRVVAISELVRDQLVNEVGVPANRVVVIENGLDPIASDESSDHRRKAREDFGTTNNQFVLLFVAELRTPRKNFDAILRALPELPEDVVVVAAGEHRGGPYPDIVKQQGLQDRVRFLGFRRDVRQLYAGADAFVLVSHYEPFGLVVTEAMASGVPVITSKSVGAASVVSRHDAGIVIDDPANHSALADAVTGLYADRERRTRCGENGRAASMEMAWPLVSQRYERLLGSFVAARDPKGASA